MDSLQPIIIDDGDLHDILYQPTNLWTHKEGQSFHGSTFSNGFTNAQAQLKFNGTGVVVYGAQTPAPAGNKTAVPPSVTFVVDGVIPMVAVSNPNVPTTQYASQFFDSHTLPAGEHVLEISVQYGADDWPFVLDYIEYTPMAAPKESSSSSVTSGNGSQTASHTVPIVAGFGGGAALVGGLAFASWYFYKRKRRPDRMAKKYGHYVFKEVSKKPDLADHFGEYKPTPESVMMDAASSSLVHETHSHHYYPMSINETVMYPPTRRGSMDSLSEMEFAHLPHLAHSSHVLRRDPLSLSHSPSRPGTPSSASAHGRPLPMPTPALYRPGSPSISISHHSVTTTTDRSTPSHPHSRPPLQLASGSAYNPSTPQRPSKHAEAEKAYRPPKPATFHADSGVRFTSPPSSEGPGANTIAPPAFLQMDPARMGKTEEELLELEEEERRRKKEKCVSLCGTAISEVPPVYTER